MPPVQRKNHAHESINRVPAQRFVKRPARKLSNFRLIVQFSYRLDTVSDCQTFRVCTAARFDQAFADGALENALLRNLTLATQSHAAIL